MRHIILVSCLMLISFHAFAAAPKGVVYTPHNISEGNPDPQAGFADSSGQQSVCVFCHTPHGGTTIAGSALWNRNLDGLATKPYGTYNTIAMGVPVGRTLNPETLLCLSCHDGSITIGSVINPSNADGAPSGTAVAFAVTGWNADAEATTGMKIGDSIDYTAASPTPKGKTDDLTDDHPISFDYNDVLAYPGAASKLRTVDYAEARGIRFFPLGGGAEKRVECSSCHDPHVDYGHTGSGGPNAGDPAYTRYAPFLVMSNYNSALCLACHDK